MKIIFIDDSTIVLDTLKSLVLEMIDSKIIVCDFFTDSISIKKMIEEESLEYDLMFIDINMPIITGYDLAKTAKKIKKYKYKPIIAITSEYTSEAKEDGKKAGIDGWFIKSITQDSLQLSIVNAIKQLYKDSGNYLK
ncbi:response regulator [Candidatus Sulfurimonas marisnigri]|uniref:Response regulator n=1 Tax=Candidatus Sulfurimonas marisnigri TaxID=2740405 RepID=A0A7S7M1A7_9BACT|nr:response regulator [Candidatus Sulfurimonas marisnigri]QOY55307.1 response regulator [Candidatus Sulfurimonas marisnigri]